MNLRHVSNNIRYKLRTSQDVEENPGPTEQGKMSSILVTSYNVRGLNDEKKLRHLLNYLHKRNRGKDVDFIAGIQESYIDRPGIIPYLWRGNYFVTPGNGNSCGCITLLSAHLNVVASHIIADRAHVIACQKTGDAGVSFIIANIYAPNQNTNEKITFFEDIFDKVHEFEERYNCTNSLILGDFNLTFAAHESKNRNSSIQERRVASAVKNLMSGTTLTDVWASHKAFTWRRANTDSFSTIDRLIFSSDVLLLKSVKANWALSFSDHSAVEVELDYRAKPTKTRTRIARIDPSIAKSPELARQLSDGVHDMMAGAPGNWDPHTKLEFLKVCIRTVAERVQAERNRRERTEEQEINEELNSAIEVLSKEALDAPRRDQLIDHVEELRIRKSILIEEKGARLAERLGTKWYNEGEKSTRYFLRILNRGMPDDFTEITLDSGEKVNDQDKIKEEIVNYYKNLYENFEREDSIDDLTFFENIDMIPGAEAAKITRQITEADLRETLHSCQDSAPGPDGIPYSVIGLLWPIFGKTLCDAWNHSLVTKKLSASHKASYLKLIPKAGKDLSRLTNWRPITLSNCDHKIITKTYAKRLWDSVAPCISGCQTAYLKSRLINDNIRAMIGTLDVMNIEQQAGLLLSLDARKAFDSVNHKYIERCLESFGCGNFVQIFKILYTDLSTDIFINGKIENGFRIMRGVKQGDALSCILFIMCMEPLIRNIENNNDIEPILSVTLNKPLPKVYAYADDINAAIKNTINNPQGIFKEYERLSKMSGLILNAEKTELLQLGRDVIERTYKVEYLGNEYTLQSMPKVKINGIFFQRDRAAMVQDNVDAVISKIDAQCRKWSRRNLSTLGKVLIMKTFGISNAIYLMQSMLLENDHIKKLNLIVYKFIWNRHFIAAKAPERVKREIVNTPVNLGGYGMIDIASLDESLKLRALGRLLSTTHPYMLSIKGGLDFRNFFDPKDNLGLDGVAQKGIEIAFRTIYFGGAGREK